MFCIFIPAIYFYIGPCFGLLNNLAPCHMRNMFIAISLLVANVFNLIVAPSGRGHAERLVRRRPATDAASLRAALLVLAPTGFWATYHLWLASRTIIEDQKRAIGYTKAWAPVSEPRRGQDPIDRRWLPLNALRAFEGVAKHRSFTAAANALLISQSALSRHVIALEKLIGVQLFERRPHALVLTKAGQHLLPAVMKSFDRLEYALDDIRNEGPALRTLRVQMPPSFAAHLAVPILRDFRRAVAEVEIDLVSPYGVGPPLNDVDVAVVYSKPTVTDLVTDLLWPVRMTHAVPPELAARFAGRSLARVHRGATNWCTCAFRICRAITCGRSSSGRRACSPLNVERGLVFDTAVLAVQYALSGEGIALVDNNLFGEEIRTGRLVKPFDNILDDGYGYYLITHPKALSDTAIALVPLLADRALRQRPGAAPRTGIHLAVSNE